MDFQRREILCSLSTILIAGCQSTGDAHDGANSSRTKSPTPEITSAESGPPYFEQVEITGPDSVEVGEEFYITVTAANTGGRDGDFTTTLSVGFADIPVEISDIEPGTRDSTKLGAYQLDRTDELVFRITDYNVDHTLSITPTTRQFGEMYATVDGLRIRPRDLLTRGSLLIDGEPRAPPKDKCWLYVQSRYTNRGDETLTVPGQSQFPYWDQQLIEPLSGTVPDSIEAGDEENYGTEEISPGNRMQDWMVYEIPRGIEDEPAIYRILQTGDDQPEIQWELRDDQIERIESTPNFELTSFTVPSQAERHSTVEVKVEIENSGGRSGTFYGSLIGSDMEKMVEKDIEGSTSTTINIELPFPQESYSIPEQQEVELNTGRQTYRKSIDYQIPERSIDQWYTSPTGIKTKVTQAVIPDTVKIYDSWYDEWTEVQGWSGQKLFGLKLAVSNGANFNTDLPSGTSFRPVLKGQDDLIGGIIYPGYSTEWGETFRGDISGNIYVSKEGANTGDSRTGWTLWRIDNSAFNSDLEVLYQRDSYYAHEKEADGVACRWQLPSF